ncbi:MAG: acyl-CoA dehydrogenase family protein [Stellaceae bacterium]
MELSYTKEEQEFRQEVRAFLKEKLSGDLARKVKDSKITTRDDMMRWHRILYEKGWIAPAWPKQHGGAEWSIIQRHIYDEEAAEAGAPAVAPFGLVMCGPVIMKYGNQKQKDFFLPKILSGDIVFCQGYSEPGSGSDLASLKTKAEREGDNYRVNGQKTWTSMARWADWIFCLVRTDPAAKKQEGISFLLIDMKTPGIRVRPIVTMDGGAEINETFLDDVIVPQANRIGEENKGWTYAKFLLGNERTSIGQVGGSKRELKKLKDIAKAEHMDQSRRFRDKVALLEIELMALEQSNLRMIASLSGGKDPGAEASILKIRGSEIQQRITELTFEALGPVALPFQREALEEGWNGEIVGPDYAPAAAPKYFNMRKTSIYGGSNEIQHNILAKAVLGL